MALAVKVCGLNTEEAVAAAARGHAAYVGLMFYPPSPRFVDLEAAARLARLVPDGIERIGVFVDADDETLGRTLDAVPLDMLQFHGSETAERVFAARNRFGLPVIKAVKLASPADLAAARGYEDAADILLFDSKPPADMEGALPGGNALAFDWKMLAGSTWNRPWFLSGGLHAQNLAEAAATSGARMVDVSSGVETSPGRKSARRIAAFLKAAAKL